jgi:hypothetical protein
MATTEIHLGADARFRHPGFLAATSGDFSCVVSYVGGAFVGFTTGLNVVKRTQGAKNNRIDAVPMLGSFGQHFAQ